MNREEPSTGYDRLPRKRSVDGLIPRSKPFTVNHCFRQRVPRLNAFAMSNSLGGRPADLGGDRSRKPHLFQTDSEDPAVTQNKRCGLEIAEETFRMRRTVQFRNGPAPRSSRARHSAGSAVFKPCLRLVSELLQNSRFSAKGETLFEKFSAGRITGTRLTVRPAGFAASHPAYLPDAAFPALCSNPAPAEYLPERRVHRRQVGPECPAVPRRQCRAPSERRPVRPLQSGHDHSRRQSTHELVSDTRERGRPPGDHQEIARPAGERVRSRIRQGVRASRDRRDHRIR